MSKTNLPTILFAKTGPIPLTIPLPKYLSIPSVVVGGTVRRTVAFSCHPCSLSRTHAPSAVSHSPAQTDGEEPTTVTRSRWPVAFTRRTQKPESSFKKVTRSMRPEIRSECASAPVGGFTALFSHARFGSPLSHSEEVN